MNYQTGQEILPLKAHLLMKLDLASINCYKSADIDYSINNCDQST